MSQVEDKILELSIENKQFEAGAKQSLQTIEELKNSMKFDDMAKNLSNFGKEATKNFDLSGVADNIEMIKERFSATGIASMEVIRRLTDFAIDAGKKVVEVLTTPFEIMKEGGWQRAMNIDEAKFQLEGLGVAWEQVSADINYAVADTAYGLDAAAKACSQLSASGVQAGEDMQHALRGISGVAAMTNSQYEEIAPIFTTIAGQGKLMTMQLRQLESRGLNAAAVLGKALGKTEQEVRDMVTKGKIDFKTFADAMDDAFGAHATKANETFEGALNNMKFALKKIGAEFAAPLRQAAVPVFNQTRLMINEIKNNLMGIVPVFKDIIFLLSNKLTNALYKITEFLKNDFTGAQNIANGFKNIVQAAIRVAAAVSTAFKEVFGTSKSIGDSINGMAQGFENLTAALIPSDEALIVLKNVLASVFLAIKNVWQFAKPIIGLVGQVASVILKVVAVIVTFIAKLTSLGYQLLRNSALFKQIQESGGLLAFAFEKVSAIFSKLKAVFTDSNTVLGRFGIGLKSVVSIIVSALGGYLLTAIVTIIEKISYIKNNFPAVLDTIKQKISDLVTRIKQIPVLSKAFSNFVNIFNKIKTVVSTIIIIIKELFTYFTEGTTRSINSGTLLEQIIQRITTAFNVLKTIAGALVMVLASVFNTAVSVVQSFHIEDLISKFGELIQKIKELELVKTAIDAFRNSGGNLVETFKAVIDKIKEFFAELKENGVSVLDFFVEKIKNVITIIKEFFSSLGGENLGKGLKASIADQGGVIDTLKEKFVKVKDAIVSGLKTMREEGLLTKVLMVAYVMAILKALIQIPSSIHKMSNSLTGEGGLFTNLQKFTGNLTNFVDDLRRGVKEGTSLFGALREAVVNWGNAQRKNKIELLGGLLKDIAISIGILAASLAVLTLVDTTKLKEVAIVLGTFSAVLIAVAGAVTYCSQTSLVKDSWFSSFAANMLAMTISIAILGGLLVALSKIEMSEISDAIGIVVGLGVLIATFSIIMKKMMQADYSGVTLRSAIFMISFALSMKILAKTLAELSDIKINDFQSFAAMMIGCVGSLAILIGLAAAINPASALAVVAIVYALDKILTAFKEIFTNFNFTDISQALIEAKSEIMAIIMFVSAMATIIAVAAISASAKLAIAGASIGKGLLQVGAAFMLFGAGLLLIQTAIRKLSNLDLFANEMQGFSSLLITLGSVVLTMAGLLGLANKLGGVETAILKIAGAVALLSVVMFNVSVVAHIVKNLEAGPILKALGILVTIMGMMAIMVAAVKSGNGTLAFKTVLATVIGFTVLIGALIVLGLMCSNDKVFQDLIKGLVLITEIMLLMSLVLMQVSKINTGQSWKPILSMVVMLAAVVGALYLLGQSVKSTEELIALGGIALIIMGTLAGLIALTKSLTKFAKENNLGKSKAVLKSLAALGVMLAGFIAVAAVLAGFAAVTKDIDAGTIAVKAGTIILALAVLVMGAEKMTGATKKIKWGDFGKFAALMGAMIVALLAVAGVVAVIGTLDLGNDLAQKVIIVGALLAELVLLSILMGKFGTASKGTFAALGALAVLTVIFGLLAAVCIALNLVPMDNTLAKSQIVVLILAELVLINAALGKLGAKTNALGTVGALCLIPLIAIFGLLALVCAAIGLIPTGSHMLAKTQIVMLVLTELIGLNALLGLLVESAGVGALGIVGAICLIPLITIFGLLALVCAAIGLIPAGNDTLAKTQIVMLVLTELIALNSLLGLLTYAAGVAELGLLGTICLIPLIAIFGLLALICAAINILPLDGVLPKTQDIILVLLELEGLLALLGVISPLAVSALLAIPGLLTVCAGLLSIAAALKLLEGMSVDSMQATLDLLTGALWELVGIGAVATAASIGLTALGASILMMGAACLAAGNGVLLFAEGIASLASTTPDQLTNLQNVIITFCTTIATGVVTIIISTGQAIVEAITTIINGVVEAITAGVPGIVASANLLGTGLVDGFKQTVIEILKIPGDIVSELVSAIGATVSNLFNAGIEMGKSIVEGFRNGAQWHSPPAWETLFFGDVSSTAQTEGAQTAKVFENTGQDWGTRIKNKFNETVGKWDFNTLKAKGAEAVQNIIGGLQSQEGSLLSEVNILNGIMGQLANGVNLAARGYQTTLSDFEYQLTSARSKLVKERDQFDYVNGTKKEREAYKALNEEIGKYDEKLKKTTDMMGKASDGTLALGTNLDNLAGGFGKAGGAAGGAANQMKGFAEDLQGVLENQMNIFEKFEKKEAMSKDELLANMQSQIQGMTEWANDMQILSARGLDQGLYKELAMMGPQGAQYVGAFKEMTAAELAQANQLWAQSLILPKNVANQISGAFNGIGQGIMSGMSTGIIAGTEQTVQDIQNSSDQVIDKSKEVFEINSPSHVFQRIGEWLCEGLANGINSTASLPVNEMVSVCSRIYTVAKSNLDPSFFRSLGKSLMMGLNEGLNDKDAWDAIEETLGKLQSAIEALGGKKEDEENGDKNKKNSTSRSVGRSMGEAIVTGMAEGIGENTDKVADAASDMGDVTIDALADTITAIGEQLDNDESLVITPVLDLSNVEDGVKTIDNMFSSNQALNASASLTNDLQNGQQNGSQIGGTTFIQNNYSPKALSRVEIYRQTKNQFAQYREALS